MKTINIIKAIAKWLLIILCFTLAVSAVYFLGIKYETSSYYKSIFKVFMFLLLIFYVIAWDKNSTNKIWENFTKEFAENKNNLEWLTAKHEYLLNSKHTNIFRKGVLKRMFNLCDKELRMIEEQENANVEIIKNANTEIIILESRLIELKDKIEIQSEKLKSIEKDIILTEQEKISKAEKAKSEIVMLIEPEPQTTFTIKDVSKADLARLLDTIYEKYKITQNEKKATKAEFFKKAGIFFNQDYSNYQVDLQQAYSASEDTNLQFIKGLSTTNKELYHTRSTKTPNK